MVITLMIRRVLTAAVLIILLLPTAANANGGPLYEPAKGHGLLQLDENSEISLVREKIVFSIDNSNDRHQSHAEINVQYELYNNSDTDKEVDVLFLTPYTDVITVSDGDKQIETSPAPEGKPVNWHATFKNTVTDPLSGKALRIGSHGSDRNQTIGTRIPLSFGPHEKKNMVVRYEEDGGIYEKGVINPIYSHLYYLTPAEFWEGEPKVELEIQLHAPGGKLYSNLPMEQVGPKVFKAAFNHLPGEDWYFSYLYPNRLLFPTNIEKDHNLLILGTAAALTVIAAGFALLFKKSMAFTVSMLGILGFTVYYISRMGGYPFNAIFVAFTDIAVGAALILCDTLIRRRIRKRRDRNKTI
ncbi:hypothetical protein [Candidatus Pristimantibacillus sp. PTI5]|uniref:hypothetical protein n=1 Tax=Candidatus Pristimantibacillus sp. PTI5 TaxID=3400422 RepID=UPI003B011576